MGNPLRTPLAVAVTAAALLVPLAATASVPPLAAAAAAAVGATMAPIGGGYETPSLEGFGRLSAQGASGPTVDLVVVPSAYGDGAKDRAENLVLAQQRTDQVDAACDAVVTAPYTGCTARLAVLLNRKDAMDPANSVGDRHGGRHLHPRWRPGPGHEGARRVAGRGGDGPGRRGGRDDRWHQCGRGGAVAQHDQRLRRGARARPTGSSAAAR